MGGKPRRQKKAGVGVPRKKVPWYGMHKVAQEGMGIERHAMKRQNRGLNGILKR